jgi:hypothetical protein
MSDCVVLGGVAVELTSSIGQQFVTDCVRSAEGLLSDRELVELYEITPADWGNITKDTALIHAIQVERSRRVRNGTAAREMASKHFVKAPTILDRIMSDEQLNARHRVDAIKEMRAIAAPEKQNSPAQSDRFHIVINLGEERIEFNKSIAVNPNADEQPKLPEQPKLTLQLNKGLQSDGE